MTKQKCGSCNKLLGDHSMDELLACANNLIDQVRF
jgi:hypothetical protein